MSVAKRVIVSGRVQGVFFRDSCRQEAKRLGVSGTARNLADGNVEVIAEGEQGAVDTLIKWCKEGPSYAAVDSVEVSDSEPTGASGFRVT